MDKTYTSAFDALCDTPIEAANLKLRADLMMHISDIIKQNGWIDKFSLDALVNINAQLGQMLSFQFTVA